MNTRQKGYSLLEFKQLTLSDTETIRPFYTHAETDSCDATPGGALLWRDYFQTEFTVYQDTLVFKVVYLNNLTCFPPPVGQNVPAAMDAIESYCQAREIPLYYCAVAQDILPLYQERFDLEAYEETDWADYIYAKEDLYTLRGKRYNGQRNHINYFLRTWPDWRIETITPENLPAVLDFFRSFETQRIKESPSFQEEKRKTLEILENYETYGLLGAAIFIEGRVVAFALGELLRQTMFVHVEKADLTVRGAYQMITHEFVKRFAREDTLWINREDDGGDPGLRKAKQDYHPAKLLKKYTVLVKG